MTQCSSRKMLWFVLLVFCLLVNVEGRRLSSHKHKHGQAHVHRKNKIVALRSEVTFSSTISHVDNHNKSCIYEGTIRKHGEAWSPGPCLPECHCMFGRVKCSNLECPDLNCAKSIKRKWKCCPECPPGSQNGTSCGVRTVSGNANSSCCTFPFKYSGVLYYTCTYQHHNKPWCSVTPNFDRDGIWGVCVDDDKLQHKMRASHHKYHGNHKHMPIMQDSLVPDTLAQIITQQQQRKNVALNLDAANGTGSEIAPSVGASSPAATQPTGNGILPAAPVTPTTQIPNPSPTGQSVTSSPAHNTGQPTNYLSTAPPVSSAVAIQPGSFIFAVSLPSRASQTVTIPLPYGGFSQPSTKLGSTPIVQQGEATQVQPNAATQVIPTTTTGLSSQGGATVPSSLTPPSGQPQGSSGVIITHEANGYNVTTIEKSNSALDNTQSSPATQYVWPNVNALSANQPTSSPYVWPNITAPPVITTVQPPVAGPCNATITPPPTIRPNMTGPPLNTGTVPPNTGQNVSTTPFPWPIITLLPVNTTFLPPRRNVYSTTPPPFVWSNLTTQLPQPVNAIPPTYVWPNITGPPIKTTLQPPTTPTPFVSANLTGSPPNKTAQASQIALQNISSTPYVWPNATAASTPAAVPIPNDFTGASPAGAANSVSTAAAYSGSSSTGTAYSGSSSTGTAYPGSASVPAYSPAQFQASDQVQEAPKATGNVPIHQYDSRADQYRISDPYAEQYEYAKQAQQAAESYNSYLANYYASNGYSG